MGCLAEDRSSEAFFGIAFCAFYYENAAVIFSEKGSELLLIIEIKASIGCLNWFLMSNQKKRTLVKVR